MRLTNISQSFPHKMAENSWYEEITSLSPYVYTIQDKKKKNNLIVSSYTIIVKLGKKYRLFNAIYTIHWNVSLKLLLALLSSKQVTLCDSIWHVSSSSGEACCELLYPVTFTYHRASNRIRNSHTEFLTQHFTVNATKNLQIYGLCGYNLCQI